MSDEKIRRPRVALSRRQTIAAAATVGVGLMAGSGIGIAAATDKGKKAPGDNGGDGDLVVIVIKNLGAGTLNVFVGTNCYEVRDKDLANRMAKAARKS